MIFNCCFVAKNILCFNSFIMQTDADPVVASGFDPKVITLFAVVAGARV
jgi:hypothetical protein